jgi:predicted lipoprotein with Yx(FWY)xxD motif
MRTSTITWIVLIIVVLLGGWYWWSVRTAVTETPQPEGQAGLNGSPDQTNTGQQSVSPVVRVASSTELGKYLIAANGMTLYLYTKDAKNVSNCSGACLVAWPAYTPVGNEPLVPGEGISGTLATITRADGSTQLTYNGIPLYFWKNDVKPGDTTGQNVGGVWFVVKP